MSRPENPLDRTQRQKWFDHVQSLAPEIDPHTLRLMERLRLVAHALHLRGEDSLAESGLSFAKWRLLSSLHYAEFHGRHALSPSEISDRQGTSRNTISALIRDLEADGLVARELDQQDRRRFNIMLTTTGRSLVEAHARRHMITMHQCFSDLSDAEQARLGQLLEKLGQSLAASAPV